MEKTIEKQVKKYINNEVGTVRKINRNPKRLTHETDRDVDTGTVKNCELPAPAVGL